MPLWCDKSLRRVYDGDLWRFSVWTDVHYSGGFIRRVPATGYGSIVCSAPCISQLPITRSYAMISDRASLRRRRLYIEEGVGRGNQCQ